MWLTLIININNFDIIFNLMDHNLLELSILNRQNISENTALNGIRATQNSFAGALDIDSTLHEIEFDNLIILNLNFINNKVIMLRLNQQNDFLENENLDSEVDFDENYISDEDFNFSRYEWTSSDFVYDDTDWQYNSS